VGFQVVLIVGQADVVVPENLSAAANYNCLECLTYALASQLVLTLDGPLSEAGMASLQALWAEIAEYGRNIQNVPLSEIQATLSSYKAQIMAIVQADPSATQSSAQEATPAPSGEPGPAQAPTAPASSGTGTGATRRRRTPPLRHRSQRRILGARLPQPSRFPPQTPPRSTDVIGQGNVRGMEHPAGQDARQDRGKEDQ
jgi:putative peptide zinc metalloprotease protein